MDSGIGEKESIELVQCRVFGNDEGQINRRVGVVPSLEPYPPGRRFDRLRDSYVNQLSQCPQFNSEFFYILQLEPSG